MIEYEVTEIISYIFADSGPSFRHLQTLFVLRQYSLLLSYKPRRRELRCKSKVNLMVRRPELLRILTLTGHLIPYRRWSRPLLLTIHWEKYRKINLLNLFYIKGLCYGTDPILLFEFILIVTE